MRNVLILFVCVLLVGCVSTSGVKVKNLGRQSELTTGMNKKDVAKIMGDTVTIGYEITNELSGSFKPITVKNPHRTQTITVKDKVYEVQFYFTHIRQADTAITDDELTPLVFENNVLVGKGWYFLNKLTKKR